MEKYRIELLEKRVDHIANQQDLLLSKLDTLVTLLSQQDPSRGPLCPECGKPMTKHEGIFPQFTPHWECAYCEETGFFL